MQSSAFTVVYDACVLYPAPLRDFLMRLALTGRFRARWSNEIQEEWRRNVILNRPDLDPEALSRTVRFMNQAIPDVLVNGHEHLINGLVLPDLDDRHVLAAAIKCHASVIVTFNEKDFPAETLAEFGIETQHPDVFVEYLFDLDQAALIAAAQAQRLSLKNPTVCVDQFLETLLKQGMVQTTKSLSNFKAVL